MTDIVIPTDDGADIQRACGCVDRLDPDWDALVVVSQCAEHGNLSTKLDFNLPRLMDRELDETIVEALGGRRAKRIWPSDVSKGK